MPELRKLLENDLLMLSQRILDTVENDQLRALQGEGRCLRRILKLMSRPPLEQAPAR